MFTLWNSQEYDIEEMRVVRSINERFANQTFFFDGRT